MVISPAGCLHALMFHIAYNAFVSHGKSSSWCKSHALSFRALSRAVSIRSQLKKYMQRFNAQIESCQGDAKRLRQCLVNGYRQNGARWIADGTYRSIRGNTVSAPEIPLNPCSRYRRCYMSTPIQLSSQESRLQAGLSSTTSRRPRRYSGCSGFWVGATSSITLMTRMSIITEVEPEW